MITTDAAFTLGVEDKVGSIAPGKYADFTVLHQDPYEVPKENSGTSGLGHGRRRNDFPSKRNPARLKEHRKAGGYVHPSASTSLLVVVSWRTLNRS